MAPADDPAFQRAMDDLLLQVDTDNILAVHNMFKHHAKELTGELLKIRASTNVGNCGYDPISPDAAEAFNLKITDLLDVHWKHADELHAVAEILWSTARDYGKSESEIQGSFDRTYPQ